MFIGKQNHTFIWQWNKCDVINIDVKQQSKYRINPEVPKKIQVECQKLYHSHKHADFFCVSYSTMVYTCSYWNGLLTILKIEDGVALSQMLYCSQERLQILCTHSSTLCQWSASNKAPVIDFPGVNPHWCAEIGWFSSECVASEFRICFQGICPMKIVGILGYSFWGLNDHQTWG